MIAISSIIIAIVTVTRIVITGIVVTRVVITGIVVTRIVVTRIVISVIVITVSVLVILVGHNSRSDARADQTTDQCAFAATDNTANHRAYSRAARNRCCFFATSLTISI